MIYILPNPELVEGRGSVNNRTLQQVQCPNTRGINYMSQEIDTLLNLAYIYMNYGKTKRAVDYLLIAYRIDPDNIQVKKMKIAAFRDLGAFPQALEIIAELEQKSELSKQDRLTLKLMKSFCLKGNNRLDEGKAVFAEYIKLRKEFAKKEFMKKYRKQLLKVSNTENSEAEGDLDAAQEIRKFVRGR